MQLVVLGLNHRTAPVGVRECFSFPEERIKMMLRRFQRMDRWFEGVILSTCNRTELYAVVEDAQEDLDVIKRLLARMAGEQYDEAYFYCLLDEACIRHLFRVSASLDSLVVGEGQILSQVKAAYALARSMGTTGIMLNTLFNRAIAVGKRVRTDTRIAYNSVSVSSAAVELAKKITGDLTLASVLVVGAGKMAELTAQHLIENGVSTIFVSNRNSERAKALATRFHGIAIPFEDFLESAENADIVITSTGAPHYIVKAWDVAHILPKRMGKPLVFIDIAVPRDVEPEVAALTGATLYNIDDLEAVVEANRETREAEALAADPIIEEELAALQERMAYLSMRPVMTQLKDKMEFLREKMLKRTMVKLPDLDERERRAVENLSKMLLRKFLRDPMMAMQEAAGTEQETFYRRAIKEMFNLTQVGEEDDDHEAAPDHWDETK